MGIFDIEGLGEHRVAHVEIHEPLDSAPMRFNNDVNLVSFVSSADIVEPVSWKRHPNGFIVAIVPEYC
jgi:hypothetical protein